MIELGQIAKTNRTYTDDDIAAYADQSGVEVTTISRVPEPLLAAQISYLLGVKLPGNGTMYLKQEMQFPHHAPLDREITTTVKITELRQDKGLIDLWASCELQDGTVVCEGRSLVMNKICWD